MNEACDISSSEGWCRCRTCGAAWDELALEDCPCAEARDGRALGLAAFLGLLLAGIAATVVVILFVRAVVEVGVDAVQAALRAFGGT